MSDIGKECTVCRVLFTLFLVLAHHRAILEVSNGVDVCAKGDSKLGGLLGPAKRETYMLASEELTGVKVAINHCVSYSPVL